MTHSHLGQQVKALHPQAYGHIDDAALGRAMAKRFPGVYQIEDMDAGTVPETPATLKLQLEQIPQGIRRVVFIARGSKAKVDPAAFGARKLTLPSGEFIYDPKAILPKDILAAVMGHRLNEILGSAEKGYGAPPKEELRQPVSAVVSRDERGETVQGTLTDPAHKTQTIEAVQEVTPKKGSISVESPAKEIANRLIKKRRGDRWPKPGAKI